MGGSAQLSASGGSNRKYGWWHCQPWCTIHKKSSLDKVDPAEVAVFTITGGVTAGASLIPMMTINGLGAFTLKTAEGDSNPLAEGVASAVASGLGSGMGKLSEFLMSKINTSPLAKSVLGNVFGSSFSEFSSDKISNVINGNNEDEKEKN